MVVDSPLSGDRIGTKLVSGPKPASISCCLLLQETAEHHTTIHYTWSSGLVPGNALCLFVRSPLCQFCSALHKLVCWSERGAQRLRRRSNKVIGLVDNPSFGYVGDFIHFSPGRK